MKSKLIFLTFNDHISGIFNSQVVDFLYSLKSKYNSDIKLISFFSLRSYFKQKKKLKKIYPNCVALPMFPKLKNWKLNGFLLKLFVNSDVVICRGVFAANIAFIANKNYKVVYDGRGAIKEEFKEYGVGGSFSISSISALEKKAVTNSFFRLAVSEKLVEYWEEQFNYKKKSHLVIPCTLPLNILLRSNSINRGKLNFKNDDVVVVFSGGSGIWQSYELIIDAFEKLLIINEKVKLLLLCKENHFTKEFIKKYNDKVICKWVNYNDVFSYLSLADYGFIVRDDSITNYVSSPVKFAEYLHCGLKVLISPNIGDYSKLVQQNNLGYVIENGVYPELNVVNQDEKNRVKLFSQKFFTKDSNFFQNKLDVLMDKLNS